MEARDGEEKWLLTQGKRRFFLLNLYDSIFVEMESPTDLSLEYLDWKERTLAMQTSHHEVVSLVV